MIMIDDSRRKKQFDHLAFLNGEAISTINWDGEITSWRIANSAYKNDSY